MSVPASLNVAENDGTVQVCATLHYSSNTTDVDIPLTLTTSDGSGMYYTASRAVFKGGRGGGAFAPP